MTANPPRRHRPTQADVARLAGVSQALVSYVLNESQVSVPEHTRTKVWDAIHALRYVPNSAARALRTNLTKTIGLVIPDITNPFYPAVERGVQESAEAAGYQLVTYNTDGVADKERAALRSISQGVHADGAIVYDFHLGYDDYKSLLDAGVAIALVTSSVERLGSLAIDRFVVDTAAGAERMTAYLIERGYAPIAVITGSLDTKVGTQRLVGFRRALEKVGIDLAPDHLVEADFTYEGGRDAMIQLLGAAVPPRAVFAANDLMALGALGVVRDAGMSVPATIAIAGIDDIDAARMVTPRLTTVRQPQREIGREVTRLLLERLSGDRTGPAREGTIELELIVRDSA